MRKKLASVAIMLIVAVFTIYLAGCGNAGQTQEDASQTQTKQSKTERKTITPYSLSHGDRSLWFKVGNGKNNNYENVSKDAVVYLYVFEEGKLTYKSNYGTQLGKVSDMPDDEVIKKFEEGDAWLKEKYQNADPTAIDKDTFFYILNSPLNISTVILNTDDTGNQTTSEELAMYDIGTNMSSIAPNGADSPVSEKASWKMTLSDPTEKMFQIYDAHYGGFKLKEQSIPNMWFVTRVNDSEECVFTLDAVGTEGTERH